LSILPLQSILPIWRCPGGKGHFVSLIQLLQLLLPTFIGRLQEKLPNWPNIDVPDGEEPQKYMLGNNRQPSFEIAVTFDGRSKPRQHFLSAMIVVKQAGFEEFWQKPDWIYTTCEVEGHDSASNMRENIMPFWKEVQRLIDGEKVIAYKDGQEYPFSIVVQLPADMKAHWALFGCGGRRPNVCHRCMVSYEELEYILGTHTIQVCI
jgi:hypothetical protein